MTLGTVVVGEQDITKFNSVVLVLFFLLVFLCRALKRRRRGGVDNNNTHRRRNDLPHCHPQSSSDHAVDPFAGNSASSFDGRFGSEFAVDLFALHHCKETQDTNDPDSSSTLKSIAGTLKSSIINRNGKQDSAPLNEPSLVPYAALDRAILLSEITCNRHGHCLRLRLRRNSAGVSSSILWYCGMDDGLCASRKTSILLNIINYGGFLRTCFNLFGDGSVADIFEVRRKPWYGECLNE